MQVTRRRSLRFSSFPLLLLLFFFLASGVLAPARRVPLFRCIRETATFPADTPSKDPRGFFVRSRNTVYYPCNFPLFFPLPPPLSRRRNEDASSRKRRSIAYRLRSISECRLTRAVAVFGSLKKTNPSPSINGWEKKKNQLIVEREEKGVTANNFPIRCGKQR